MRSIATCKFTIHLFYLIVNIDFLFHCQVRVINTYTEYLFIHKEEYVEEIGYSMSNSTPGQHSANSMAL